MERGKLSWEIMFHAVKPAMCGAAQAAVTWTEQVREQPKIEKLRREAAACRSRGSVRRCVSLGYNARLSRCRVDGANMTRCSSPGKPDYVSTEPATAQSAGNSPLSVVAKEGRGHVWDSFWDKTPYQDRQNSLVLCNNKRYISMGY